MLPAMKGLIKENSNLKEQVSQMNDTINLLKQGLCKKDNSYLWC